MNPYDHARSSARIHGGLAADYQPLHDWFDLSESAQCHFTHRALRHHHEGIAVAVEIFGPVIRNADGVDVATDALGRQHVGEDCPSLVHAVDWLVDYDVPAWLPATVPTVDELAERSPPRFSGEAGTWRPLHAWFLETRGWVDDTHPDYRGMAGEANPSACPPDHRGKKTILVNGGGLGTVLKLLEQLTDAEIEERRYLLGPEAPGGQIPPGMLSRPRGGVRREVRSMGSPPYDRISPCDLTTNSLPEGSSTPRR